MGHAVRFRLAVVVACLAGLALAGCGRRGPLELPAGAPQPTPEAAAAESVKQDETLKNAEQPGLIQSPNKIYEEPAAAKLEAETKHPKRAINAPPADKPSTFVLDKLL